MAGNQFVLISADGNRLQIEGEIRVGRSEDSDLRLVDGAPSRNHARLWLQDGAAFVEDCESTNGTFVNGSRLASPQKLENGDTVAFDVNQYTFEVVVPEPAGDRTVLRKPDEGDRTMLRPVLTEETSEQSAEKAPEPEPSAAAPSPPPPAKEETPPAAPEATPESANKLAGAWADPSNKGSAKTAFMSLEELQQLRSDAVGEKIETDEPVLHVLTGDSAGSVFQLNLNQPSQEWSIGSLGERDIVLKDAGVSEFHTLLSHTSGRWKVVDQMSTNGTFVNGGKTISGFLNDNDKLRVGPVECQFLLGGASAVKPSAAGKASTGSNKTLATIGSFEVVLAILFGLYFWLG